MNTKETSNLLLQKFITYDRYLQDEIIKLGGIDRGIRDKATQCAKLNLPMPDYYDPLEQKKF